MEVVRDRKKVVTQVQERAAEAWVSLAGGKGSEVQAWSLDHGGRVDQEAIDDGVVALVGQGTAPVRPLLRPATIRPHPHSSHPCPPSRSRLPLPPPFSDLVSSSTAFSPSASSPGPARLPDSPRTRGCSISRSFVSGLRGEEKLLVWTC